MLEQSSGQLSEQIGKFVDALEQFTPKTPGGIWYKAAIKAIYKAAKMGDASDAGQLAGMIGKDSGSIGDRACAQIQDKGGYAPAVAFQKFSDDLVRKIKALAEKKEGNLPPSKSP